MSWNKGLYLLKENKLILSRKISTEHEDWTITAQIKRIDNYSGMLCITSSTNLKDEMINFNQIWLATHKYDTTCPVTRLSTKDTENTRVSSQEVQKE